MSRSLTVEWDARITAGGIANFVKFIVTQAILTGISEISLHKDKGLQTLSHI